MKLLPVMVAIGLALAGPARAEGLLELYEAARAYDATWQSAKAQYEANVARGEQARAGILPQAALSAGISAGDTVVTSDLSTLVDGQKAAVQ